MEHPEDDDAPRPDGSNRKQLRESKPPAAPVSSVTGIQLIGTRLAVSVLAIITLVAVALLAVISVNEFVQPPAEIRTLHSLAEHATERYLANGSPETIREANDLLTKMIEARKASRDFWTNLCQLLLLNLLLPVLTSILGYVFGTMQRDD